MNPWEEDLTVVEAPSIAPWEENLEIRVPRGVNLGGYVRNVLTATPLVGNYEDEVEATLRSPYKLASVLASSITGTPESVISNLITPEDHKQDYEMWRRNAEESARENIKNAPYGRGLNVGASMAENAILAGLTGGLTLMPGVSGAQGAIEGFGEGEDLKQRITNAAIQGTASNFIPRMFNKIAPTKDISKQIIKSYAKRPLETAKADKKAAFTIIAKALEQDKPIEDVIANEVSKGYRTNLWNNLKAAFRNEDVIRSKFYKSAAEILRNPYEKTIEQEVRAVSPKYASKIGNEIKKIKKGIKGSDILSDADPREVVTEAANNVMRKASSTDKKLVANTIENAQAKIGVAKEVQDVAKANPAEFEGTWASLFRMLRGTPKNISNYGTLRSMTQGVGSWGNWLRGATDDFLEDAASSIFKTE